MDWFIEIDANWIIAISTFLYVFFTGVIIWQNRRNLRFNDPYISSYFNPWKQTSYLELVIENVGKTPAYNLHLFFDDETKKVFKKNELDLPEQNINYFPSKQKISHFIGHYSKLKKTNLDYIIIYLEYETKKGRKIKENIKFNYDYMEKIELNKTLLEGNISKVTEALNKINQTIKNKK